MSRRAELDNPRILSQKLGTLISVNSSSVKDRRMIYSYNLRDLINEVAIRSHNYGRHVSIWY